MATDPAQLGDGTPSSDGEGLDNLFPFPLPEGAQRVPDEDVEVTPSPELLTLQIQMPADAVAWILLMNKAKSLARLAGLKGWEEGVIWSKNVREVPDFTNPAKKRTIFDGWRLFTSKQSARFEGVRYQAYTDAEKALDFAIRNVCEARGIPMPTPSPQEG